MDIPKVELHRHFEGSLPMRTLVDIAKEQNLDLPGLEPEDLSSHLQVVDGSPDFQSFLAKFPLLRRFFTSKETIMRLAYECVVDAVADNIKYLELRFNPVAVSELKGFSYEQVTGWISSATNRAQQEHDILVKLIVQIGRDESIAVARRIAEVAVAFRDKGVVGLDLAGDEMNYPAGDFAAVFLWAKDKGLHITIHAGEVGPASNITEAIEKLGADRIGHGVRAFEDDTVVDLLVQRGIPLEMCPTSNVQTGVVSNLKRYPLIEYQRAGVRTTINTDDPSIFDVTLAQEYNTVLQNMEIPLSALRQMIITAAEVSFLPEGERIQLTEQFHRILPDPLIVTR